MNRRIISAFLVFLLLASVAMPAAAAGGPADPPQVYYELRNMCKYGAHVDLGKIPLLTFGIGYEGRFIDDEKDKWILFIHAGAATKRITVAAETPAPQLMLIRDFVNAVKECKAESDQVSLDLVQSLTSGLGGSFGVLKGILTDDGVSTILGAGGITYSAEEVHQFVLHFNAAKNAQKNAEKLFGEVFE